jgi:hypothetical protein
MRLGNPVMARRIRSSRPFRSTPRRAGHAALPARPSAATAFCRRQVLPHRVQARLVCASCARAGSRGPSCLWAMTGRLRAAARPRRLRRLGRPGWPAHRPRRSGRVEG